MTTTSFPARLWRITSILLGALALYRLFGLLPARLHAQQAPVTFVYLRGTDTIASGNPTTPTVTIPLGDSGIGAVAGALSALLPAKAAAPTNAAVPATP
jgi:hypothetical protein